MQLLSRKKGDYLSTIYVTERWDGFGKQDYYWHAYRLEGTQVVKYKCHKYKHFNGDESEWMEDENIVESWETDDPSMPEWLRQYL